MSDPANRSHTERVESAARSFRYFVPEAEPERVAEVFARRLGPLGAFVYETVGPMWDRPALARRDRSLFIITTLAAQGREDELFAHTQIGLRHGLTDDEVIEILPHVVAAAGFPAAMAAGRQITEALRQAAGADRLPTREGVTPMSDDERDDAAAGQWSARTGRSPDEAAADVAGQRDVLGHLADLQHRWHLGQIWSRPGLSAHDRSIVAISALVTVGADDELAEQISASRRLGLTDDEIREVITHLGLYVGLPRANAAMRLASEVLDAHARQRRARVTGAASALVLTAPRSFERRTYDLPDIGADDGLLRIEACGLCGTDHEQYTGDIRSPHAFIPGHEVVGMIERVGDAAARRWGVTAGQRVAVEVFKSCRSCEACRDGLYRRCERNGLGTMVGFIDADQPPGIGGGYATHLHLGPDSMLLPVPDSLDPVTTTLFNPLGAGIRWAADLPGTGPGDVVAVLGPGVRGLCAAAAAKEAGAEFVMVTGLGPRDAERLAIAPRFGADLAVDVATTDPSRALREAVGAKADVVVDVTAKAPAALGQAVQLARTGGTIVLAGVRNSTDTPGFDPDHIIYKELTIHGALGVDVAAYRPALDLLASGRYPFAELPRQVAGFDDIEQLVQTMAGERTGVPPIHAVFSPDSPGT